MSIPEILGFIGTILVAGAYFPQIIELWKRKNSTGISIAAWLIWLIGDIIILPQAFSSRDRVFIFFQVVSTILVLVVLLQAVKYRRNPL